LKESTMQDQATQPSGSDEGATFTVVASMDDVDPTAGHTHLVHEGHIHVFAEADCDDVEGHGLCSRCH
jgi:hypothetical protein